MAITLQNQCDADGGHRVGPLHLPCTPTVLPLTERPEAPVQHPQRHLLATGSGTGSLQRGSQAPGSHSTRPHRGTLLEGVTWLGQNLVNVEVTPGNHDTHLAAPKNPAQTCCQVWPTVSMGLSLPPPRCQRELERCPSTKQQWWAGFDRQRMARGRRRGR